MKLAYSTNGYTGISLDESLARIAGYGYTGVEILADMPHMNLLALTSEVIQEIKNNLSQSSLLISNINANTAICLYEQMALQDETLFGPSLCSSNTQNRIRRVLYTKKAIDLAAALGAASISITSGRPTPGNPPEKALANFLSSLEPILEYAAVKKIFIGIEYEPGLLVENADEFNKVLEICPYPNLGLNLDIGHSIVAGEDVIEVIRRFHERIWNVHVEDIKGRKHYHLIPGQGDIDLVSIVETLDALGYNRFLTVELYTYKDDPDWAAARAYEFFNQIMGGKRSLQPNNNKEEDLHENS